VDLAPIAGAAVRGAWSGVALGLVGALAAVPVRAQKGEGDGGAAAAVVVVVGAEGAPEYGARFRSAAERWQKAAGQAGASATVIGLQPEGGTPDRRRLQEALTRTVASAGDPAWLVLIGHGTFDGRTARFNLRGPDLAPEDLAAWCKSSRRPLIIINTAPASAPFLKALTGPDRVVVTATRAGSEKNATRFGGFLAEAIADAGADLDLDGGISVLEAFLFAAKRVEASYKAEGLLATEHALLEDNSDGRGTPASFFRGLAPGQRAEGDAPPDGHRAHQLALLAAPPERALPPAVRRRRDELELKVLKLRDGRGKLATEAYHARLEPLLLELGRIYQRHDPRPARPQPPARPPDPSPPPTDP
jgi:hypothetical protein